MEQTVSLPDKEIAWEAQRQQWRLEGSATWVLAGVQPQRHYQLTDWLNREGRQFRCLESRHLGLAVSLPEPDKVGIDRLLNAVAFKARVQRAVPGILIDAGSAVTVDWVDEVGAFRGGAIFPGIYLMARALHYYTALLPLVEVSEASPSLPGTNTREAITAGVYWATAGGIKALVRLLRSGDAAGKDCEVFLTGGDAALLAPVMDSDTQVWQEMTLEGVRVAAENLP